MSEDKATKAIKEIKIGELKEEEIKADIEEVTALPGAKAENIVVEKGAKPFGKKKTFAPRAFEKKEAPEFEERVIGIDRVTRVVKGGRRMRFRALVVVGDKKGRVGYGVGKGNEVSIAVGKGVNKAKKSLFRVEILSGTIAHDVTGKSRGAKVLLKSAKKGRGIIAGGSVRVILELAGFNDVVAKSFGSSNKINNVRATLSALSTLIPHKRSGKVIKKDDKTAQSNIGKDEKSE